VASLRRKSNSAISATPEERTVTAKMSTKAKARTEVRAF
jgi:hypothetical protein